MNIAFKAISNVASEIKEMVNPIEATMTPTIITIPSFLKDPRDMIIIAKAGNEWVNGSGFITAIEQQNEIIPITLLVKISVIMLKRGLRKASIFF